MYEVFLLIVLLSVVWLLMKYLVFAVVYFIGGFNFPFWLLVTLIFLGFSWLFGD